MTSPAPSTASTAVHRLRAEAREAANRCIQCGYCLPVCPTYHSMGKETHSPRGRINLVKAAADGKIDLLDDMAPSLDLCLGCRACETACPVGVPYGQILEAGRAATVRETAARGRSAGRLQTLALKHLFPHPGRLRAAGRLVEAAQRLRLDRLVFAFPPAREAAPALTALGRIVPSVDGRFRLPPGTRLSAEGEKKRTVAFFQGCVMDAVMPRINWLTVELLRKAGCEVVIPAGQTCCGALHVHQGLPEAAAELVKRNLDAFEETGAEWIVNNAGGCGAMLCECGHVLADAGGGWPERAAAFAARSRDISQVLVETGLPPLVKRPEGLVTLQESCHLRNVQKAAGAPEKLLRETAGDRFRALSGASDCCASGGIFNLLHFEESMAILDAKMDSVRQTAAVTVVTSNPGCHLQMRLGIRRAGLEDRCRAVHLVEYLAECAGLTAER